ncbi:hypothetical protein [Apilactobacillus xinyiensis]|uniref:DUF536 domain-containing protein n=1 Tax=Apilactobacillus xinyiensis TaxID=2841032 RepID=A0ABT0I235_9LACO|nr:hypothetical protein [Apilactobacillus xinyiensis]MCK8624772.1 hypothetical protein [Apilactobacillus xinyiensis]MCL0319322.1 hypothetical protein [Apilactobacillus xinyiensis]MCL0329856.1 hypothetical protein [Apilactobacillus xinyiensis]
MSITIKEIALELGITKQAVQSRMNDIEDFRDKYTTKSGNKLLVNEEGYKLLSNGGNNKRLANLSLGLNSLISEQLNDKKVQINKQNQQINELHKMLDDAHKIHLHLLDENKKLKQQLNQYKHKDEKSEDNNSLYNDDSKKSKPIFSRLFHKE